MPFTPPKLMAWEWGLQSARRLFKPTAGGCGLRLTYPRGLYSSLDCRLTALWPAANEFPQFVSEPWTNHESIVHSTGIRHSFVARPKAQRRVKPAAVLEPRGSAFWAIWRCGVSSAWWRVALLRSVKVLR